MKKIFAFLALAILLFGCAQYGAQTNSQSSSQSGGGNKVFIKDFKFGPPEITVKKGDTVTWINNDPMAHTVKFGSFESGLLSTGQSFSHIFNDPGDFEYACGVHPSMKGKVIVK